MFEVVEVQELVAAHEFSAPLPVQRLELLAVHEFVLLDTQLLPPLQVLMPLVLVQKFVAPLPVQ